MRSPITDYLRDVVASCAEDDDESPLSVAVVTVEGTRYGAGDTEVTFPIQSISKALTYALALGDHGLDAVHDRIDVEPSGDAFNEISLEAETGRPRNAMINAGAIAAHSLVHGADTAERADRILALHSAFVGRELAVDESVVDDEMAGAHRNLALAHMLASVGVLACDPHEVVEGYARQCSIDVTSVDLAVLAATMANGGVHPDSGERVAPSAVMRQVLSTMTTCGMYDGTGDWIATVGIPAKSGVSGAVIGVLPGQLGIAVHSPGLDDRGNSIRGVRVFERLSRDMDLHMMDIAPSGHSAVRATRTDGAGTTYELQGDIRFVGAENIMSRVLDDSTDGGDPVTFDLEPARAINGAAIRLLTELIDRLRGDGRDVHVEDPNGLMDHRSADAG
ncbi:glutaminase A [Rhodococcoides corynebacterioides]|uniref:Glutaminase n=1 Tax=Rhodococcoides corynebacterioides TaxID=53972 RepID=A0ABS7P2M4_9NOCA|nr:glutaminase A [Rhodococcus corynebacterioides]MBY6366632.1 glutaminase A [Rhodococcus corynebacterioides]MBY6408695.1 glutaminase A [Rhodococcus corynebacterioides]